MFFKDEKLMIRLAILFLVFLYTAFYGKLASSGAWLQKDKSLTIINSNIFYYSDKIFSNGGSVKDSNIFTKFESSSLIEYGYNKNLTIGLIPIWNKVEQKSVDFVKGAQSLTELNIFFRKLFYQDKNIVISYQPAIKISYPYDSDNENILGQRQLSAEMRFLFGKNFEIIGIKNNFLNNILNKYHYVNTEIAYRHNFLDKTNEVRIDSTIGIKFKEKFEFTNSVFTIFTINNISSNNISNFQIQDNGFDLVKIQTSFKAKVTKKSSIQIIAFKDIWGRNTGSGYGGGASLWYHF